MSTVIDKAISAGKFPESRRAYYEDRLVRDPEGTRRLIASLEAVPEVTKGKPLAGRARSGERGIIQSSAGLPLRPHPRGGYYVDVERAS